MRAAIFIAIAITLAGHSLAQEAKEGEKIFNTMCASCHTIGGGRLVGPDLKGITQRRDMAWLKGFIKAPSTYFAKEDKIAMELLEEYGLPMPDLGLTDEKVEALLAFLQGTTELPKATPPYYAATIIAAIAAIGLITLIAIWAGRKKGVKE